MLKSHQSRGFGLCLLTAFVVLGLYVVGALDVLELKTLDLRFHLRGNRPANPSIAVITIDEKSIQELGRWPWPRSLHAKVARQVAAAGSRVVAFDVLFTEPDRENPASDMELAKAAQETGVMASAMLFRKNFENRIYADDPLLPFSPLAEDSFTGFVNLMPDRDGVRRRAALYAISGNSLFPSISVAALGVSQKKSLKDVIPELPVVVANDPNLAENELLINFAFSPEKDVYPVYSYSDIVNGKVDEEKAFKDKIVLVGGTAAALFDTMPIPFTPHYFGVLVHANVIDNLLSKNYLLEVPSYLTALLVLVAALILGFVLPRVSPWGKLGTAFLMIAIGFGFSQWLFSNKNLVMPVVPPLAVTLGSYAVIVFYQLVVEEKEKRKIKGSFRQYLSPKIIEVITKDPSKLRLGGEEREVSIFFLDIAGFTTMSEALKPSQLVEVMNQCLTQFSRIILKQDGLINKYIGDCIMAFWNAPAEQPQHATQACRAALECIAALPELNRRFAERGLPSIDCRVGINTGTAVVGNMGSHERFDYTVMGDAVNLASRLEGANKQYHSHIMISDSTFEKAQADIETRDLDLIRVKGKKEPRKVFEVLGLKDQLPTEIIEGRVRYHQALRDYRQKRFDEAVHGFETVFDFMPNDYVTRLYLERARTFISKPPPLSWDGVYEMLTK